MDFSIVIEENGKRDHPSFIAEKIAIAKKFGYRKIALNVKISSQNIQKNEIPTPPDFSKEEDDKFKIYTRLTVKIEDTLNMHKLSRSKIQTQYDILAAEIINEKILGQFCGGHINCDIVCFELSNYKLCYMLRKANLNLPCEKGILFEICYKDLLSSQAIRVNTISNSRLLIEKCHGKNILLSSGAKYKLDFRSPIDVSNLGHILGLKINLSKEAVFWNALRSLKHAKIRKVPICSVVEEETNDNWLKKELLNLEKIETDSNKETCLKRKEENLENGLEISKKMKAV